MFDLAHNLEVIAARSARDTAPPEATPTMVDPVDLRDPYGSPEACIAELERQMREDALWLDPLREAMADLGPCVQVPGATTMGHDPWYDGDPVVCDWRVGACDAGPGFVPVLAMEPIQNCEKESINWDDLQF